MGLDISKYFSEEEIACIEKEALEAEGKGSLTQPMLSILREKELLYLFVPQVYGGAQLNLPEALKWLEAASWLDGSLGWTLTLGAGAGLFGAFMEPDFAKSVLLDKKAFLSGSGFPGGKAEITGDGYRINGKWKYASGIEHATLVTATCYLTKEGRIQYENGEPVMKAMSLFPDEVDWKPQWKSYGLKATGSYNFEVKDVHIPAKRSFIISPFKSTVKDPLYRYPFEPFAQCTLGISLIGMAERFLNESSNLIEEKDKKGQLNFSDHAYYQLADALAQFDEARNALCKRVKISWQELKANHETIPKLTIKVSQQSRRSCEQALKSVQQVYPFLGMEVINPESDLNRFWRDLHTASQHMLLTPTTSSPVNKKGDLS